MGRRQTGSLVDAFQLFLDLLMISLSFFISALVYNIFREEVIIRRHVWMLILFLIIFTFFMTLNRMYDITNPYDSKSVVIRTITSTMLTALAITLVIFLLKLDTTSRLLFLFFCFFTTFSVIMARILRRVLQRSSGLSDGKRALFIGDQDEFARCKEHLDKTVMGISFVDCIPITHSMLNSSENFERLLIDRQVDEVFLLHRLPTDLPYEDLLLVCDDMGITVRLLLDLYELPISRRYFGHVDKYPAVIYCSTSQDRIQLFIKSLMDIVLALFGIILVSPVMLVTAIAIKLESPGPVIFKQKRAGLNGKVFEIYKFRSMFMDAEQRKVELVDKNQIKDGMMFKMDDDPRVTKVGKFIRKTSIDELPQFFNVLKRDMSLVGTRPPTLDEVNKYNRSQRRRISIRPGITGMWQVNGRSNVLEFDQVVTLDKEYIDKWSLILDFKLIFQTIGVLITRKGAK